ncbi:MAG: DUF559 domain-containing protein, partial [Chloroflexota bacterium]
MNRPPPKLLLPCGKGEGWDEGSPRFQGMNRESHHEADVVTSENSNDAGRSRLLERRRRLRRQSTDAERLLWGLLSNRQVHGAKFRRQHQLGP